jgi:hypothetical protein
VVDRNRPGRASEKRGKRGQSTPVSQMRIVGPDALFWEDAYQSAARLCNKGVIAPCSPSVSRLRLRGVQRGGWEERAKSGSLATILLYSGGCPGLMNFVVWLISCPPDPPRPFDFGLWEQRASATSIVEVDSGPHRLPIATHHTSDLHLESRSTVQPLTMIAANVGEANRRHQSCGRPVAKHPTG